MAKHFTYRGESIDMDMLKYQNQHQVALGNGKMNARGDIIGRGGTVIQTAEERIAEKERELQLPDFIPEHQLKSQAPEADDGFDDGVFELPQERQAPAAPSFEVPQEEVSEVKRAPRRAKTKDEDQE